MKKNVRTRFVFVICICTPQNIARLALNTNSSISVSMLSDAPGFKMHVHVFNNTMSAKLHFTDDLFSWRFRNNFSRRKWMKKNDDVGKCISSYWLLLLSAKFVYHNLRTGILHIGCMQYYNVQCIHTLQVKLHRWFIRYINTTSVNCVTGIAYSSGAHEITPDF